MLFGCTLTEAVLQCIAHKLPGSSSDALRHPESQQSQVVRHERYCADIAWNVSGPS